MPNDALLSDKFAAERGVMQLNEEAYKKEEASKIGAVRWRVARTHVFP